VGVAPDLALQMRIAVEFDAPRVVVDGPLGGRRVLHVTSGTFEGVALRGEVLPGGGDWLVARRDGSIELDIRFTLRTVEDEIIYFRGAGLFLASEAITARIRSGENVPADQYYFRTSVLFEAGSARLSHLNQALHVGVGQRTAGGMITDVYSVS
jgi:hypothetical protein